MDKNYKQKVKDFFRKEGFYITLFICLCVITTIGTLAYRKVNESVPESNIEENNEEASLDKEDNQEANNKIEKDTGVSTEVPNAERADISNPAKPAQSNQNINNQQTQAVIANNDIKFNKPIDGCLLRAFTYPKPVKISDTEQRTIAGIDVEAKIGSEVKAAAEGVVESVGKGTEQEGTTVLIKHTNGMKTKYCNLDAKTLVKQGDKVTCDTVIGTVGQTVKIFGENYFKEYLNIQVLNANNEQVDPLKYFNYQNKQ